jgi:cobalt-zinc-cadmium efflux system protein
VTHSHSHSSNRTRLLWALAITGFVVAVQLVGALLTGSLALFADAGHMFSDVFALTIALAATVIAAKPPTDRATFGYQRSEVFGALINGAILLVVAVVVAVTAVLRLLRVDEVEVPGVPMLVFAAVGLLANVVAALILRPARDSSINMRGAYLEVLGDMLGSVAAIVGAVAIIAWNFQAADAIASIVIAVLIGPRAYLLLRDSVRVLLQAAPAETSVAEIREHILGNDGVVDVHDVHVWSITTGQRVFSAHVVVDPAVFAQQRTGPLLDSLEACLAEHFDVEHSTFQLEPAEHARHEPHTHA